MNEGLKKLGFVLIVGLILMVLRPQCTTGSTETATTPKPISENATTNTLTEEELAKKRKIDDEKFAESRAMSLRLSDGTQDVNLVEDEEGISAYAEGYGPEDFGEAFEPEESEFFSMNDGEQPSPGGVWDDLLKLQFKLEYDQALDDVVYVPNFTEAIKKHQNKTVEVIGFILPNEVSGAGQSPDGAMFMLSAYPAKTCFFCGGAGPESVIEIYPEEPIPFTEEQVTLKGKLELNDVDFLRMPYILKDVKMVY